MTTVGTRRTRGGFVVAGVLLVAWLAWITVSITREPPPGEASLGELSAQVQRTLVARDAEGLGRLLDYPQSDAPTFAQRYLDTLGPDVDAVTLTTDAARSLLTVGVQRRGGPPVAYALRATRDGDGRWLVSFLPPV